MERDNKAYQIHYAHRPGPPFRMRPPPPHQALSRQSEVRPRQRRPGLRRVPRPQPGRRPPPVGGHQTERQHFVVPQFQSPQFQPPFQQSHFQPPLHQPRPTPSVVINAVPPPTSSPTPNEHTVGPFMAEMLKVKTRSLHYTRPLKGGHECMTVTDAYFVQLGSVRL